MCKYCEINPKTKLGRDYYRDDYVDPDEINKVNGEDEIMFTYIDCKNHPALIISHPDPECYSQEIDEIFVTFFHIYFVVLVSNGFDSFDVSRSSKHDA